MENGKPMLENAPKPAAEVILRDALPVAVKEEEQPAGTVKRLLNFRERQLIIWGAREYCKTEENGDYRNQSKLSRLQKLLSADEVVEYFAMLEDDLQERRFEWTKKTNEYLFVRQYETGALTLADLRERYPKFDPKNPPAKQPIRQPQLSQQDQEGRARIFYIPSKLDAWVQDVLKGSPKWPDFMADFVTELCEKFGVKDE